MTAYRWRMFIQVNNWIGFWIFILFAVLTRHPSGVSCRKPSITAPCGGRQYQQQFYRSDAGHRARRTRRHYWYASTSTAMVLKMTLRRFTPIRARVRWGDSV
jgi:hypothetical protein